MPTDMKRSILIVIFLVALHFGSFGQKTLLINGYLHVGNGEVMPTAAIGIINGKIVSIKNAMTTTHDPRDWLNFYVLTDKLYKNDEAKLIFHLAIPL